ncbi:methyltransferase domain-containing protein [Candidatus Roizmanbacteria bacterium]|nr:methyltransferase domain-containing protein [Candidatus Roizmanbacteria bacterium]
MLDRIINNVIRKRSETVVNRVKPYITNSKKIIDIGSGTGDVAFLLKKMGKRVTAVDVADFHGPRLVEPIIYDGKKLPFPDKCFDTALLLMVLHHTPDPKRVFSEASRVAKKIVVIETSYTTSVNRFFTVLSDTLGNLRLAAFWSSYKTDGEWRSFFKQNNYQIKDTKKYHDRNFGLPFLHIAYYLIKR